MGIQDMPKFILLQEDIAKYGSRRREETAKWFDDYKVRQACASMQSIHYLWLWLYIQTFNTQTILIQTDELNQNAMSESSLLVLVYTVFVFSTILLLKYTVLSFQTDRSGQTVLIKIMNRVCTVCHFMCIFKWASSWEKVSSGVTDQVRLKLARSATEANMRLEILVTETRDITLSRQRTTKALIRLCKCAGWSVNLLYAYDIRHVFSWPGSNAFRGKTTLFKF